MSQYNVVQTFIPMSQVVKIPDAKAAVDKARNNFSVAAEQSQEQEGASSKRLKKDKRNVHFAT